MSKKSKKKQTTGATTNKAKQNNNAASIEEFAEELGITSSNNKNKASASKKVTGTNFAEVMKQNFQAGKGEASLNNLMEEIAQEAELTDGKINTDPDIAHVKKQKNQASKSNNTDSGFTKMVEEIADEIGLFQSDNQSSSGKSKLGSEITEIKNKILKPFKKD